MSKVRWGAFVPALILAPLVPALLALLLLFLMSLLALTPSPLIIMILAAFVAAVGFGAPTYLTFGAGAFWFGLRRFGPKAPFWLLGLAANILSTPIVFAVLLALDASGALEGTAFVVGYGLIAAPIWGVIFGWFYWRFTGVGDRLKHRAAVLRVDISG
ncbi:MAG: hypothetical protein HKN18_08870 [Silicimonas sp.]|nr:hypothetical protein [Silicimonas sp.]